jgi:APA family basic amino acid/polyamine antiporter
MTSTRQLGLGMATALVVGNTIGMGIFMQPAALAPFGLNALTGWIAVIVGCVCLAISFAALRESCRRRTVPLVTCADPRRVARVPGALELLDLLLGDAARACDRHHRLLPERVPGLRAVPPRSSLLHSCGSSSASTSSASKRRARASRDLVLKVVPLILVTVVGAVSILSSPGAYTSNLPTNPITLHASMGRRRVALYTMLGFESAAVAASRVTNPEKTIPRAT